MDRILIEDLEVNAIIGTLPEERLEPQLLILNLEIFTDFTAAGISDDLTDAVDYSMIEGAVKFWRNGRNFSCWKRWAAKFAARYCLCRR